MELHAVQVAILYKLRHLKGARFSQLMHGTGMTSDVFKFHIKKVAQTGLLEKMPDGSYGLTAVGKEYANNLDVQKRQVQKQPKLSVLLLVPHPSLPDIFLFQQRLRSPYYGFWSCIGGPIQWGELAIETAARELLKQTGLRAEFTERMCFRKRDYDKTSKMLLEDKLFVVLEATNVMGELAHDWPHGQNEWLCIADFLAKDKILKSAADCIVAAQRGQVFLHEDAYYGASDY